MAPKYTMASQYAASGEGRQSRRHFGISFLAKYYPALTMPANACQRCGYVDPEGALPLDHMMELHKGGPDHPHNLIRLCFVCHKMKPYPYWLTGLAEWRLAILTWAKHRPFLWMGWLRADNEDDEKHLSALDDGSYATSQSE